MKKTKLDVEKYTLEMLNSSFEKIVLLGRYKYPQGNVIKVMDQILFTQCMNELTDSMVRDGFWIEENGEFYSLDDED